jgi:peptidoglycan/LPS O-acetylase OafA/YrhL
VSRARAAPGDGRFPALTSFRFIAGFLVFLHHDTGIAYGTRAASVAESLMIEGHLGVTLFFALSGFLITQRYFLAPPASGFPLSAYFIKRVARIWPLYLVLLPICLHLSGRSLFAPGTVISWTLTQGLFMKYRFSGIGAAWSLTVEEMFYASAPLIFLGYWRLRGRRPATLGSVAAWIGAVAAALAGIGFIYPGQLHELAYTTYFFRFFEFGAGILAAFGHAALSRSPAWNARSASAAFLGCAAGFAALAHAMNQVGGIYTLKGFLLNLGVAALSAAAILSLTQAQAATTRILSWRPFVYLGEISYASYLIHATPLFNRGLDLTGTRYIKHLPLSEQIVIMFAVLSAMSAIAYELIEKPAARAIRGWYERRRATENAGTPLRQRRAA